MFQECFKGVISFKGVSRKFQGCPKEVLRVFSECFRGVSRRFQGSFKSVLRKFKGKFKGV